VTGVSRYHGQVAAAVRAVTIRGATRYTWLGRASRPLPPALHAALGESGRREHLVSCLREELYWSFYCHGAPVPARWGSPGPASADLRLAQALSEANTGRGSWAPGWTVERLEGEDAIVVTPRLRARVAPGGCRAPDGVRPGAAVSIRLPKELPSRSPGFYTAISDATPAPAPPSIVRVYWNVTGAGAPALVRALTSVLNAEGVWFRLKVADHPLRFARCDAAVLYLLGASFETLRETLEDVASGLSARLGSLTPAFTLELAPGVGLAEEGAAGESFGLRRSALLAEGIVCGHERGLAQPDAVAARFAEAGISLDAPYLEPSLAGRHVL
jgi:hypothetical protein